jgi:hypothetical protein
MYRGSVAGRFRLRKSHLSAACVAAIASMAVFTSSALADVDKVLGHAEGLSAQINPAVGPDITLGPLAVVDMVSPPGGTGPFTDSVATANIPNVLSAGIINARTEGGNLGSHAGFATSSASVADLRVGPATSPAITATLIASKCTSNGDGSTGSSTLTNVRVLGVLVAVNPAPNTVIPIPGVGSVTLNEQVRPTNGPGDTSIIVQAIHVRLNGVLGTGDIVVAESRCRAKGPDVVPVAPLGLIGVTAMLGMGFAGMQWKKRRDNQAVAASTL